jgi:hypothetical protein
MGKCQQKETQKIIETPYITVATYTGNCNKYGKPLYFDGCTMWAVDKNNVIRIADED